MKIGIVTQPLLNNYGGTLQNYALQKVLKNYGYKSQTIDFYQIINPYSSFITVFLSWMKNIYLRMFWNIKRPFVRFAQPQKRNACFEKFVLSNILITKEVRPYSSDIIHEYNFDTIIVGSDQVWRPKYNQSLKDMFLNFAKNVNIKRIAYAASFGVDNWEYTPKQTRVCSALAKKFNAISVREESGVSLCKEHLGVDATWVLDPTLLLKKEDYLELCAEVPESFDNILAVYMLDVNESIKSFCETEAKKRSLNVKYFTANAKAELSVPEWIAMFRDASYVVTDSFHGTVFSIIFEKEFKCFYNEGRGSARFESLLNLYNSGKLDEMREFSLNWLKNALES